MSVGAAISLAEFSEVLGSGGEMELIAGTIWPA
jgi:hypothetical protein